MEIAFQGFNCNCVGEMAFPHPGWSAHQ
jgi:hypothetical protein